MQGQAELTIIVATYNRPDTLRVAISTAQAQTFENWEMLVIGDCCGPETEDSLRKIGDPRIRYVNLPARCGEQSGPNSVGMALVETPYLAFLNHDDVWTPDHLETALASLKADAEFFCGRVAFCLETGMPDRPWTFTEISPRERMLGEIYFKPFYLFESVSSWVLNTAAARRVGPWHAATEIYRKPIENWLLRAWREGLELATGQEITVLKPKRLGRGAGSQYGKDGSGLIELAKMAELDLDLLRMRIGHDIAKAIAAGASRDFRYHFDELPDDQRIRESLKTEENARIFLETGQDAYEEVCRLQNLQPGNDLRGALKWRTGEELSERPPLAELIEHARSALNRSV